MEQGTWRVDMRREKREGLLLFIAHVTYRYTKMGYASNVEPSYIVPSAIATGGSDNTVRSKQGVDDLDFYIGDEALNHASTHQVNYPIRQGIIDNWDNMERIWQRCIFKYLRCEPEEHYMLLVRTYVRTWVYVWSVQESA